MQTVEVRSGNKYLTIPVDEVDRYVAKGYDVVDASGKVVVKSIPSDINVLKAEYSKALDEIKALKSKVVELQSELAELKAPKAAPEPEEVEVEEVEVPEVEIAGEPVDEPPVLTSSKTKSSKSKSSKKN
jgi:hypothetical protein